MVPYQTLCQQARVLVDEKSVKSIFVHGQEVHEEPVLGQAILGDKVTGEQKKRRQKHRQEGSSGDIVGCKRAQKEYEGVCHENYDPNDEDKVSKRKP